MTAPVFHAFVIFSENVECGTNVLRSDDLDSFWVTQQKQNTLPSDRLSLGLQNEEKYYRGEKKNK